MTIGKIAYLFIFLFALTACSGGDGESSDAIVIGAANPQQPTDTPVTTPSPVTTPNSNGTLQPNNSPEPSNSPEPNNNSQVESPTPINSKQVPIYNINVASGDIWANTDSLHFSYIKVEGDFSVQVTVESIDYVHQWSKSGLSVREDLTSNVRHTSVYLTGSNGVIVNTRENKGGITGSSQSKDASSPVQLRIEREGNTFTHSYKIADGFWQALDQLELDLPSDVYVGLSAASLNRDTRMSTSMSGLMLNGEFVADATPLSIDSESEHNITFNTQLEGGGGGNIPIATPVPSATSAPISTPVPTVESTPNPTTRPISTPLPTVESTPNPTVRPISTPLPTVESTPIPTIIPTQAPNPLDAAAIYGNQCIGCHGDEEGNNVTFGGALTALECETCGSLESLVEVIETTMPLGQKDNCDADCARALAGYILEAFTGYGNSNPSQPVVPSITSVTNNVMAPAGVILAAQGEGTRISWQGMALPVDYWILDWWNPVTAQWDSISRLSADARSYVDSLHQSSQYRLYAVTNGVASVPAHVVTPTYDIQVASGDIWANADSMHFSHRSVSGDFSVEATIEDFDYVHQWSKSGLAVRESLAPGARHTCAYLTVGNGVGSNTRADANGSTTSSQFKDALSSVRLRITREGNIFTHSYKKFGSNTWEQLNQVDLALPNTVYVGLIAASLNRDKSMSASMTGLTINGTFVTDAAPESIDAQSSFSITQGNQADGSIVAVTPFAELSPLTHVNRFELTNILNDVSPGNNLSFSLSANDKSSGFEVGRNTTLLGIEKIQAAAEQFAAAVDPNPLTSLGCDIASDNNCLRSYIKTYASTFARRPVSATFIDDMVLLYEGVASDLNHAQALRALHETLAMSANFIYKFETNNAGVDIGTMVPVSGFEMASRLSFALWGTVPDKILLQAAARGQLATPAQIKAQAERMVEDSKMRRGFRQFYYQWLHLEELLTKDKALADPDFDTNVARSMLEGFDAYIEAAVFSNTSSGDLSALMTSPLVGNNANIAKYTGINTNSQESIVMNTQGTSGGLRSGILGQPAMLALLAHDDKTSIVERGVFINQQLMCNDFPPPPESFPTLDTIDPEGKSALQMINELTSAPQCSSCHQYINPLGGVLENFDTTGRYRTLDDRGMSVSAVGNILSLETNQVDAQVNGLAELNNYLASNTRVKACLAKQYLSYATGRMPSSKEQGSLNWLIETMDEKGWNIRSLLVEATQTPAFLYKQVTSGTAQR